MAATSLPNSNTVETSHDVSIQAQRYRTLQQPVIPQGNGMANFMAPSIYKAARLGEIGHFQGVLDQHPHLISCLDQVVTGREDTVLHIAARLNHTQLLEYLLGRFPALYLRVNSNGDHPLHVAAAAGHLSAVQCLIQERASDQLTAENIRLWLKSGNIKGNSALHQALQNRKYQMAKLLFNAAPEVSCLLNSDNVYPLYMAAKVGNNELVECMMQYIVLTSDYPNPEGPKIVLMEYGASIVHVAIRNRNMGLLEIAYKYEQSLFERHDEKDGTPLSTAASIGYLDGVRFIVQKFPNHAYDRGPLGCCPIHRAARKGHVKVIREFLRLCPDSGELLNWSCQNILHMAAESGRANVVMFILQVPHLEMLINETDQLGNTPLHLATTAACFKVVEILTRDKRVLLDLEDNKGHTVVDAAQRSSNADSPSVRQWLTWIALKRANARGSKDLIATYGMGISVDACKKSINFFTVVATLVMTVAFSAGFAVPGGFNGSDSTPRGMAVLVKRAAFQTFVISNTAAFNSCMLALVALMWAQVTEEYLMESFVCVAMPLLGLSFLLISISFTVGVSLVVSNLGWLHCVVLVMGSISLYYGSTLLTLFGVPFVRNLEALNRLLISPRDIVSSFRRRTA